MVFDFVTRHELLIFFIFVAVIITGIQLHERYLDRKAMREYKSRWMWQAACFQGGGSVWTPNPMTQAEAMEWASRLGAVQYVDTHHNKIFYKSRGGA